MRGSAVWVSTGQIRAFAVRATSPRFHGLLLSSDITGLIEALRGTRDAWNSELPSGETDKEAESPKEVPANRHSSKDSQRHAAGSARRDRSTHPRASPSDGGHTACTQPVSLHAAGRWDDEAPAPARGNGHASPTDWTPVSPQTHHRSGDPKGSLETGNDTTARPQAPDGRPGALQGHHQGPGDTHPHTRGSVWCGGGTAHPTSGRPTRQTRPRGHTECPLRHKDLGPTDATRQRAGERGRAGFRTPAFHTPPTGGEERRGARGQSEKSGPV